MPQRHRDTENAERKFRGTGRKKFSSYLLLSPWLRVSVAMPVL